MTDSEPGINNPEKPPKAARRSDSFLSQRLVCISIRWVNMAGLALLGAVAFELILPLAWQQAKGIQLPYSPTFLALTVWLAVVLLTYRVSEPIRVRKRQWRRTLCYPPTWLAVPLACGLAAVSERLPVAFRPQSSGPDWQNLGTVVPIALAVALGVAARQLPWRRPATVTAPPIPTNETGFTWGEIDAWLSAGERPLASGDRDMFQHNRIVARVVNNVAVDRRHVALLGRFGSGKSSILNLVVAELARLPDTLVVAKFDVWAVPNPEDVPRVALSRIVGALDEYVNTIHFRSLPLVYQRLISNESTGWLSAALEVEHSRDSIELLSGLSKILATIDARLLLIVQDVERAGQGFDTRHLQRLLWALRNTSRIQFILSVDPDHAALDFPKLCDSIELVPAVQVNHVARILTTAYGHWRTKFSDIDPHPNRRDADKLGIGQALAGGMNDYMRRTGRDTPLDALVSILDTPRSLKHVLRRVDYAWNNLHGEVELDDIVIVSALRHGAEPVYRFLLADIDAARHEPVDMFPRTKAIKEEWSRVLANVSAGPAAQKLVDLMRIEQLTKDTIFVGIDSPQGVQESDPVDYFRRITAEELGPSELHDQSVLRDIDEWKGASCGSLLDRLLASSDADKEYSRVWEHFSDRHTNTELMQLVEQLVAKVKERDGSAAAADHPALIGLWRRCHRRLAKNEQQDWLRALIVDAIPVSLHLATGLFYYWTDDRGIVNDAGRAEIRRSIVSTFRATVGTGDDLARVLTSEHPYLIGRLISQTGTDANLAAFEAWSDYLPVVLIAAAKTHPDLLIAELANLAGADESNIVTAGGGYPPKFINRFEINRARMTALFADRLDEVLELLANYTGENAYAVRAIDAATAWIDERRSRTHPPSVT